MWSETRKLHRAEVQKLILFEGIPTESIWKLFHDPQNVPSKHLPKWRFSTNSFLENLTKISTVDLQVDFHLETKPRPKQNHDQIFAKKRFEWRVPCCSAAHWWWTWPHERQCPSKSQTGSRWQNHLSPNIRNLFLGNPPLVITIHHIIWFHLFCLTFGWIDLIYLEKNPQSICHEHIKVYVLGILYRSSVEIFPMQKTSLTSKTVSRFWWKQPSPTSWYSKSHC